jgi:hypothetical protein
VDKAQQTLTVTTPPSVSVIIPTCGHSVLVDSSAQYLVIELLKSFGTETSTLHEIIVVADAHTPPEVMHALFTLPKVVIESFNEPFNFSKKCNVGARRASGDIILFLNDDMLGACCSPQKVWCNAPVMRMYLDHICMVWAKIRWTLHFEVS